MEWLESHIWESVNQKGPEALVVQLVPAHALEKEVMWMVREVVVSLELERSRGPVVW